MDFHEPVDQDALIIGVDVLPLDLDCPDGITVYLLHHILLVVLRNGLFMISIRPD